MADQLISVGFGKASFKTRNFSLAGFILTPGFVRTTPNKVFKKQGQTQRFPTSQHPEVNGYLYLDSVEAKDDAVVLLQASHKSGASPISDSAIFIALRSSGPMLGIHARLPSAIESTLGNDFLVFQGRGDVLTLEELGVYGIEPNKSFITAFLDEEEFDECYTIQEIAPASAPRRSVEIIETEGGGKVAVPRAPGRRVRLR